MESAEVPFWEPQSGSTAIAWDVSPRYPSTIVVESQSDDTACPKPNHAKHSFDDELKSLLARYGLRWNPRDPL
jgi:hypothetical protein